MQKTKRGQRDVNRKHNQKETLFSFLILDMLNFYFLVHAHILKTKKTSNRRFDFLSTTTNFDFDIFTKAVKNTQTSNFTLKGKKAV